MAENEDQIIYNSEDDADKSPDISEEEVTLEETPEPEEAPSEDLDELSSTKKEEILDDMLLETGSKKKKKKKEKDEKNPLRRDEDNIATARAVVVEFLEGTFKKSEAMAYARGFIDNHFSSPLSCFVYVMQYEKVFVVEIHDGGDGKAYLPNVIKALEEDNNACVCIQNRRRTLEIKRNDKGVFSSVLLPEGIDSQETNIVKVAPSKTKMNPYSIPLLSFAVFSLYFCSLGFVFLLLASIVCLLSYTRPVKTLPTTQIKNLPIHQWELLVNSYSPEMYVEKITYSDKDWSVAQRKIPFAEIQKKQAAEDFSEAVKSEIQKEVRQEIKRGAFLTEEEKKEIAKHLRDEVIKTVQEGKEVLVKEIKAEVKEDVQETLETDTSSEEIINPIEDSVEPEEMDVDIIVVE